MTKATHSRRELEPAGYLVDLLRACDAQTPADQDYPSVIFIREPRDEFENAVVQTFRKAFHDTHGVDVDIQHIPLN